MSSPDNESSSARRTPGPTGGVTEMVLGNQYLQEECKVCVSKTACETLHSEFMPPIQNLEDCLPFLLFVPCGPSQATPLSASFFNPAHILVTHILHSILHGEKSSEMESLRNCTCNKKLDSICSLVCSDSVALTCLAQSALENEKHS